MPYRPGDRVEASTVCGWVPAAVVAVLAGESSGPALYVVAPDLPDGGFPRLLLRAAHLRPADGADDGAAAPHLVPAAGGD
jgi:hypothetical protein